MADGELIRCCIVTIRNSERESRCRFVASSCRFVSAMVDFWQLVPLWWWTGGAMWKDRCTIGCEETMNGLNVALWVYMGGLCQGTGWWTWCSQGECLLDRQRCCDWSDEDEGRAECKTMGCLIVSWQVVWLLPRASIQNRYRERRWAKCNEMDSYHCNEIVGHSIGHRLLWPTYDQVESRQNLWSSYDQNIFFTLCDQTLTILRYCTQPVTNVAPCATIIPTYDQCIPLAPLLSYLVLKYIIFNLF